MIKYLIISAALLRPAVAGADSDFGGFHMMDWYGWGGWGMFIFPLFWIFLIGAVIVLLVRGISRGSGSPPSDSSKSARAILEERYAKGEIDKAKFEEMKKDISD